MALAVVMALVGVGIRLVLLATPGFVSDLNQFAIWIRHIAESGLSHAYDAPLPFGPVMAWLWWLLGVLAPSLLTGLDGPDVALRIVMKVPAAVADLGLAAAAWYVLRAEPRRALVAVGILLLHPGVWLLSSWWGQYESVFSLLALVAFALAARGRDRAATVALAAALLTKPQALPLALVLGVWFVARAWPRPDRWRHLAILGLVAAASAIALWLPFIPEDGPGRYLAAVAGYQDGAFSVLSVSAWNLWWLLQQILAPGGTVFDDQAFAGFVTLRVAGVALAVMLWSSIAFAIVRRPTPSQLALALAASALVASTFLTTMHERYAFAALPFLALFGLDRRIGPIAAVFGIAFVANILATASVEYLPGLVAVDGLNGIVGSITLVAVTLVLVAELLRRASAPEERDAIPVQVVG